MEPQGRARGRARGRVLPSPGQESSSPAPPTTPPVARSRGRGIQQAVQAGTPAAVVVKKEPSSKEGRPAAGRFEVVRTRPEHLLDKRGISGASTGLLTNFFALTSKPDFSIYQYMVTFRPEIDRIGQRRYLLKPHKNVLRGYLFDGISLFSNNKYGQDPLELVSQCDDGVKVTIEVKYIKEVDSQHSSFNQVMNIIARKCLSFLGLTQLGRGFFDPQARIMIPEFGLELWPGYATSIRQHENNTLMCTEITCKVLRNESVLNVMEQLRSRHQQNYQQPLLENILGVVIMTDYNNRTYRIDDVDFSSTPLSQFTTKDGKLYTFKQYYRERYNINLRNLNQPLLVSRSHNKMPAGVENSAIYLVPELCRLTGLTDEMRNNFNLMKAIADHTRMVPGKRINTLMQFSRRLLEKQEISAELSSWNMKFNPNLTSLTGRVLPMESIVQGSQNREIRYDAGQNVDWTMKLRSNELLVEGRLDKWVVVIPSNVAREARHFIGQILQAARGMHINISEPSVHEIRDDSLGTYINGIEEVLCRCSPDILVCMVSNNRSDRYAAIKKKCCVERSVPTQVITKRSMCNKNALSIATKIAIQMNCKVGGAPWTCVNPLKGLMVCGFDATHDTMKKGNSYGGFVASLNNTFSRYFSTVFEHPSGSDLSNSMASAMKRALEKFQKYNEGSLPSRIVFYRDGVGDGQIPFVFNNEVEALKEMLSRHYQGNNFRLSFVIVNKRINTRFFSNNQQNPTPGTVVDDIVTLPERYDFFIVSQSVRQGTVSPTSYNVIFDNSGLDPDKMQRLTYKMTHLYFNWSGTIKVPAPVQYAHKLAMLVGQFLHREPQCELDELLYFL